MKKINIKKIVLGIVMDRVYILGLAGIVSNNMNHWDNKNYNCSDGDFRAHQWWTNQGKKLIPLSL